MAMIPDTVVEEIRSQTNITDVVSQYVSLHQSGKNLFGLCPFHEERTPSFSVSESKQIFHCFSCGRGGNVFTFLMELEHLSFPEAVQKVATIENFPLASEYIQADNTATKETSSHRQLVNLYEEAAKLYHHILVNTKLGRAALDYLHQRDVSDEMINEFNLGYAPDQRLLKPMFEERKIDYQLLRKSGLFSETQSGDILDRFVDRVMYPIREASGATIAFSGRLLTPNDEMPKYLNSPETEIFNKGKTIFNLDKAKVNIRQEHSVILFEGFMDVITAYNAGIVNGVASMGTSLTDEQVYDLKRITNQIFISYDGDQPGQKATKRAIDILNQAHHFDVKIVVVPDGMDPDEFIRNRGEESFRELLKGAQTEVEFQLLQLQDQFNLSSEAGQSDYIHSALKVIATINSSIDRDLYLNQLAAKFNIDKMVLKNQLPATKTPVTSQNNISAPINYRPTMTVEPALSLTEKTERRILKRMLYNRDVWLKVTNMSNFAFIHENYQMLFLLAEGYFETHDEFKIATFETMIKQAPLQQLLIAVDIVDLPENITESEIDDYLNIMMYQTPIQNELDQKKAEMKEAARLGDSTRQRRLAIEIISLEKKKRTRQ